MPHKAIWVNGNAAQEIKTVPGSYRASKGELLLRMIRVAVNAGDYKHPEFFAAVNTAEGFDAVGRVVDIGPEIPGFKIGDKVVTLTRGIGPPEYGASREFLALAATSWTFDEKPLTDEQAATSPLTVGIQAIQFTKFRGRSPIIVTASSKQHDYLLSSGANFAFDYKDGSVTSKTKGVIPSLKRLMHALDCVGTDIKILEELIEEGGTISLALPPTRPSPRHHVGMAVAGTIYDLETFTAPEFKFHGGKEPGIARGQRD
ncbi:uncharacterized protein BDZ99DRAFT_520755 [Mytilinidion resinicola]|uniref:Alcohol dehydrogenase-like N-terminal domain-containing protein n=1 Tax=Mytilinidion resinicola TaxID=574789 RepID=A0A6A6YLJ1_9PEZI|nr:uncharacterized protein BDZ99DRAFT_520755 [Mytilinidion resinicola]KAF2809398.1 hypothetical protein BDZ99DRAFT_520755 [Mytilinidion resinicola]